MLTPEELAKATQILAEKRAQRLQSDGGGALTAEDLMRLSGDRRIAQIVRAKTIAALWIVGASQRQLASAYQVARPTIADIVSRQLSADVRAKLQDVGRPLPNHVLTQYMAATHAIVKDNMGATPLEIANMMLQAAAKFSEDVADLPK